MDLHDAIAEVLARNGSPMSYREVADALNATRLYVKGDGGRITEDQIRARVSKPQYAGRFVRTDGRLSLAS
jgi:hypothetical protein